jgi:hypothetical protein
MADLPNPVSLVRQLGYVLRGKAFDALLGFEDWVRARMNAPGERDR